ncbi:MAG TPA: VWA domain-containing protein [Thermoanaerobaculia bacterium]|nr:VWA domain-containing protein [Thermoanaerobaculia bacterium]
MSSDLVVHLARFAGALRRRGVGVSLSDEADGLAALTLVDVGDRDEVGRALRAALKIRPHDEAVFAELFARLWSAHEAADGDPGAGREREPRRPPRAPRLARPPARQASPGLIGALPGGPEDDAAADPALPGREEPGYSPEAVLRRKSFAEFSSADLQAMESLVRRLARRLATRPSRRRVPVRGRGEPDLRRSFRRAVAQGGELLSLARRARPLEEPRLVVLCDTSGSMDPYTRFLLCFVLALRQKARAARSCEVFAFNTELVRLTPWLRPGAGQGPGASDRTAGQGPGAPDRTRSDQAAGRSAVDATLALLASRVPDWSGGTRIGECLAEFAARYLRELVDGRTVVLILSDGLDRGDVAPLAGAMRAIRARARRVFWLNPLAGDRRYEPTARAMAAALPYVDRLLPAHNLESLAGLLPLLAA